MSRYVDQKIYRTFEEFEREELRRDSYVETVDQALEEMFAGSELQFEPSGSRRSAAGTDDEEE